MEKIENGGGYLKLYGAFLKQEIFIDGKSADNMLYNAFEFNNEINKNINSLKSYVGFGLNYHLHNVKPKYDPNTIQMRFQYNNYNFNNIEFNMHYSYNDMDKVFFATNGTIIKANVSRSFLTDNECLYFLIRVKQIFPASTNGYTKFGFSYERRVLLKKKITGHCWV